jgi:hypothetical protein
MTEEVDFKANGLDPEKSFAVTTTYGTESNSYRLETQQTSWSH